VIQIDSPAGPSDVLIISDATTNPKWVAFDLLSQAEHDEMSIAVLLTTSSEFARQVQLEIEADIQIGGGRIEIKKKAIQNSIIIITPTIEEAIEFSNKYAPEHMQLMVNNAMTYIDKVRNVGSLFIGNYSPVAVGDYYSGTNHILPTGGTARFSSGTSVDTFIRRTTYQHLTLNALKEAREPVSIMSQVEGFDDKHGGSVEVRFEE
jgi:histidinol dehydrogenase